MLPPMSIEQRHEKGQPQGQIYRSCGCSALCSAIGVHFVTRKSEYKVSKRVPAALPVILNHAIPDMYERKKVAQFAERVSDI
jgi:hypothetical protein